MKVTLGLKELEEKEAEEQKEKPPKSEFAKGQNHINGIENFWGYARLSNLKE